MSRCVPPISVCLRSRPSRSYPASSATRIDAWFHSAVVEPAALSVDPVDGLLLGGEGGQAADQGKVGVRAQLDGQVRILVGEPAEEDRAEGRRRGRPGWP